MNLIFGLMLSTSLILFPPYTEGRDMHSFNPKEGFLPDEETAIAVAEIILIKIYGINQIKKQRPLSANLKGDIWDIKGSLSPQEVGGTAHIRIKKNGEIIQLSHSR